MNVGLELFFCEKKSALKISVIWGLGAYSGCHVCLLIDCENVIFFFFKLGFTSRPITDHLPYLSYNQKCSKDHGRRPADYKLFDME